MTAFSADCQNVSTKIVHDTTVFYTVDHLSMGCAAYEAYCDACQWHGPAHFFQGYDQSQFALKQAERDVTRHNAYVKKRIGG